MKKAKESIERYLNVHLLKINTNNQRASWP